MNSLPQVIENEQEVWKSLEPFGFPGYEVSSYGRIRSYHKGGGVSGVCDTVQRIIKLSLTPNGYPQAAFRMDGSRRRTVQIHVLVARVFLCERPEGMQVCHYDNDKTNNRVSNLRYDTPSGNLADRERFGTNVKGERNGHAVLTEESVVEIRTSYGERQSYRILARKYGVDTATIARVVRGETWRHVGGPISPISDCGKPVLEPEQVIEIRQRYAAGGVSMKNLGQEYGVNAVTVFNIVHRKQWKHLP